MTLRLNGSTSGYVEIDAPATAGSNTLTLPDGGGSSGQYLQTDGSGGLSWQTVTSPAIVQRVVKEYSTASTFTSPYIAFDNTIPQDSETHLIITQAFTPVSTTNKLFIAAQIGMVDLSAAGNPIIAGIFDNQPGGASARAVAMNVPNPAGYALPLRCEYEMGGTLPSSITFYVRVGITAGTLGINRRTDAQYFGGTVRSYLVIDEVRV